MKFLVNKKINYTFPDKTGLVDEQLIITDISERNKITFITVTFPNKKKYVEHCDEFHKFNIYKEVQNFLYLFSVEEFHFTLKEIDD